LDTPLEVEGRLTEPNEQLPVAEDLYAQAIRNRPETRTIALREQMAKTMVDIAKANATPTVGLFANYQWNRGSELPPNDAIWRDGYQAGALVSVPLFDGRATEAQVAEAEANLRQVKEGERMLDLGVRTQVSQAALAMRAAREQIDANEAAVKSAEKNFQVARERYGVGLASNLEVMDASTQLLNARAQLASSLANYENAKAQLEAAIGSPRTEVK
jgi:outer membrane protein TolC